MGMDCTVCFEYIEPDCSIEKYKWQLIGIYQTGRNTSLFQMIIERAHAGYPDNVSEDTVEYLTEHERWGECWLSYKEWLALQSEFASEDDCILDKDWKFIPDFYKKRYQERIRIIFRFDN